MDKTIKILIIDGYNIINAWEELKDLSQKSLEDARDKLNQIIREFCVYKGIKGIIVYDAYRVKSNETRIEDIKNLEIVFTKENETADTYIEKYITNLGPKRYLNILVATDDSCIQEVVIGKGGSRISSRELYIEYLNSNKKIRKEIKKTKTIDTNTLGDFLSDDVYKFLDKIRKS